MPPTGSLDHWRPPSKVAEEGEPSDTLYVGGISSDTVNPDVMALFGEHGALDCATMHGGARSYAFVFFRAAAEARAALEALQGSRIHGTRIRIEFARPAKPYKHLWIGGISSSITKEQLEDVFLKFGKIEECQFFRDRNSALIYYYKTEDAVAAQKNLNGKLLADEQICVDFQRPPPLKRDWVDHHDSRDGRISRSMGPPEPWMPPDGMRNFHDSHDGPKRQPPYAGRKGEALPSSVLWIGYPPSVRIDEQMLHNAMILFGEIERIKCFPSRNYSFVEFRSVDEAIRAKEGLQGHLFNDPRIHIMFSSSELAPNKDNAPLHPGFGGLRPDVFFNEPPFGPAEFFGPGCPMSENRFSRLPPPNGMPWPNTSMKPFEPQGFDPHPRGPEFHDFGDASHDFPDTTPNSSVHLNWKRHSPALGILPSVHDMQPPFRPMPDGFDTRELKRSRIDGTPPISGIPLHGRRIGGEGIRDTFGFSHPDVGGLGQSHRSPILCGDSEMHGPPAYDHCWRGIIAKGGTHVCRARCVPIGKGIDSPFPKVINCSARTGLDILTKHYAEASGFDIVFFLPDSEEDFASYTDFLCYLGLKNRAGVAKLDDGTTLFLVPPSDFLTKVLNVSGPERLYGVVLELQQQVTNVGTPQPQVAIHPPPPNYVDHQPVSALQKGYSFVPQKEDQEMDYSQSSHEESVPHAGIGKPPIAHAGELHAYQSSNPAATSNVEVSLTPELLATLAALVPNSTQSTANGTAQITSSSSVRPPSISASMVHERSMPLQGWGPEHQVTLSGAAPQQPNHLPQQLGHQFNNQALLTSQFSAYTSIPSGPDYSAQPVLGTMQIQDPSLHMPHGAAVSSQPVNSYIVPSQTQQFLAPQSNQQYQLNSSLSSYDNYAMSQVTGTVNILPQQGNPTAASSGPGEIGNLPQERIAMPSPTDKANTQFPSQVQQLQSLFSGSGQGLSEGDADKNQRYQSTLQFAANLLLQIQQQQQQSNAQAMQGYGSQQ